LAAGAVVAAAAPEAAFANVGDTLHVGDDAYGKQTSFQITSNGLSSGGTSIASVLIGRNSDAYPSFPIQGVGSVLWAGPAGSAAIWGESDDVASYGVHAHNTLNAGTALKVDGRTSLSRSGAATISKSTSSKTVTVASGVNSGSKFLVTLQGDPGSGVYLKYAKLASATTFKVVLSAKAKKAVRFAWIVTD
jgi:hypothetical protein